MESYQSEMSPMSQFLSSSGPLTSLPTSPIVGAAVDLPLTSYSPPLPEVASKSMAFGSLGKQAIGEKAVDTGLPPRPAQPAPASTGFAHTVGGTLATAGSHSVHPNSVPHPNSHPSTQHPKAPYPKPPLNPGMSNGLAAMAPNNAMPLLHPYHYFLTFTSSDISFISDVLKVLTLAVARCSNIRFAESDDHLPGVMCGVACSLFFGQEPSNWEKVRKEMGKLGVKREQSNNPNQPPDSADPNKPPKRERANSFGLDAIAAASFILDSPSAQAANQKASAQPDAFVLTGGTMLDPQTFPIESASPQLSAEQNTLLRTPLGFQGKSGSVEGEDPWVTCLSSGVYAGLSSKSQLDALWSTTVQGKLADYSVWEKARQGERGAASMDGIGDSLWEGRSIVRPPRCGEKGEAIANLVKYNGGEGTVDGMDAEFNGVVKSIIETVRKIEVVRLAKTSEEKMWALQMSGWKNINDDWTPPYLPNTTTTNMPLKLPEAWILHGQSLGNMVLAICNDVRRLAVVGSRWRISRYGGNDSESDDDMPRNPHDGAHHGLPPPHHGNHHPGQSRVDAYNYPPPHPPKAYQKHKPLPPPHKRKALDVATKHNSKGLQDPRPVTKGECNWCAPVSAPSSEANSPICASCKICQRLGWERRAKYRYKKGLANRGFFDVNYYDELGKHRGRSVKMFLQLTQSYVRYVLKQGGVDEHVARLEREEKGANSQQKKKRRRSEMDQSRADEFV
ncbi:hypothetical protein TrST_g1999 [Triparma strigata]|uniref:Uncharacterized protein n=2 Tax=Triparma strigata TaxID=1606541 RepID=A0A9W7BE79_9STRA|nr:hypothetical protein TrST_g1999 [Triparma strigata]